MGYRVVRHRKTGERVLEYFKFNRPHVIGKPHEEGRRVIEWLDRPYHVTKGFRRRAFWAQPTRLPL